MAERDVLSRLEDILDAIAEVRAFAADHDLESYRSAPMLRRAIERCIEIVSEASRHVPTELKLAYSEIPWQQVAGVGNILRHGYEVVSDAEIWRVVTRDLDPLETAVRAMYDGLQNG